MDDTTQESTIIHQKKKIFLMKTVAIILMLEDVVHLEKEAIVVVCATIKYNPSHWS